MRIGVFLDDIRPDEGGNFTLSDDIADAFLEIAGHSRHEFVLFCSPEYAAHINRSPPAHNVCVCAISPRGTLGRAISGLRHYLPISGFVLRRPGALERRARREGIQLMWLVGGVHDTIDIPYISTVCDLQHRTHPWFPEFSANWKWDHRDLFYGRHLRRATRIITGTEVGRSQIEAIYGVPRDNIRILPHPTPSFALKAASHPGSGRSPVEGVYMLYPAQFWAHKNHVNLLLAWQQLLDRGHTAPKLVFVGSDKGNRAFVEARARALGLKEQVVFMGFVPTEDLVALYRNAEAMIYASFSGPENLPPLEAFALGCPSRWCFARRSSSAIPGRRRPTSRHSPTSFAGPSSTTSESSSTRTNKARRAEGWPIWFPTRLLGAATGS